MRVTAGNTIQQIRVKPGFTVIELLVVISIMVLMITLGVVSFNTMSGNDLENATKIVVTGCNSARQLSMSTGLPVALDIIDRESPPYFGSEDDPDEIQILPYTVHKDIDPDQLTTENKRQRITVFMDENQIKFHKILPPAIDIALKPNSRRDDGTGYDIIEEGSSMPTGDLERNLITFRPDGSSDSPKSDVNLPWTDTSVDPMAVGPATKYPRFIILEEKVTGQRALIYVFASTSYVKEKIE